MVVWQYKHRWADSAQLQWTDSTENSVYATLV